MNIRKTEPADLTAVMRIYHHAQQFMQENGNPGQWGTRYPMEELIREDIAEGTSYVGTDEAGQVHMVFRFVTGADPTYQEIWDGGWLNEEPYGVIHRIASDGQVKGALKACLDFCDTIIPNIRIDTHEKNVVMRHSLAKYGFVECGRINTDDGTERIAFQRIKNTK